MHKIQAIFMALFFVAMSINAQTQDKEMAIVLKLISQEQYENYLANAPEAPKKPLKMIKDQDQAMKLLTNRIKIGEEFNDVTHIYDDNGQLRHEVSYGFFHLYYPEEDLLILEGGHTSTLIYSFVDGRNNFDGEVDMDYSLDDPAFRLYSPNGQRRYTGYSNGQSDSCYIQQQQGNKWHPINNIKFSPEVKKTEKIQSIIQNISYLKLDCRGDIEIFTWIDNDRFIYLPIGLDDLQDFIANDGLFILGEIKQVSSND